MNKINCFPGHMAKAYQNILETINQVDLVLEVVDARAIKATSNPIFDKFNKPLIKVALKSDLADIKSIENSGNLIIGSIKDKSFKNKLLSFINKTLAPNITKKLNKGIKNPILVLMVVGLPNVGKSSLINFLGNKKQTIVGNKPAVTKSQAMIKIAENLYLQDNPGIFFKKVDDDIEGFKLTLVNTVRKEIIPIHEVNMWAYNYLIKNYFKEFNSFLVLNNSVNYDEFIKLYANKRNFIMTNNQYDIVKAENAFFEEIVKGNICKINYEKEN